MSVTAELPDTTLSAPQKKAPKPIMGIVPMKRGNKVHHSSQSTKSVKSATKVLFKNTQDSSTDSDDVLFCESSDTSPLSVHNNTDDELVSSVCITHNTEKQNEIMDTQNMHRVTHSVFKQTQK